MADEKRGEKPVYHLRAVYQANTERAYRLYLCIHNIGETTDHEVGHKQWFCPSSATMSANPTYVNTEGA